jgi:hypothetical protein
MSMPIPTPAAFQWPPEVLEFAAQSKVAEYLDPLLEATRRLFPTARSLRVYLADDPEIRDDRHIVIRVEAPKADVPDAVKAQWAWGAEFFRIVPAPLVCTFRSRLSRVDG